MANLDKSLGRLPGYQGKREEKNKFSQKKVKPYLERRNLGIEQDYLLQDEFSD